MFIHLNVYNLESEFTTPQLTKNTPFIMKKTKFLLLTILAIVINTSLTSCKDSSKGDTSQIETPQEEVEVPKKEASTADMVVGNWILSNMEFKVDKDAGKEDKRIQLTRELMKGYIGKIHYDFNADKTSKMTVQSLESGGEDKIKNGTWSLSSDNKIISISSNNGKEETLNVISTGSKELVLSTSEEGMGEAILTFTKK